MTRFQLVASPAARVEKANEYAIEPTPGIFADLSHEADATNAASLASAMNSFGQLIRQRSRELSFLVCAEIVPGARKPRWYASCARDGGLREEAFLFTIMLDATIEDGTPPVRMWGAKAAPFQLSDRAPVWTDAEPDEFTPHAHGHLGYYGWLRMINARVQLLTNSRCSLFDRTDASIMTRRYKDRHHPFAVASELMSAGYCVPHNVTE